MKKLIFLGGSRLRKKMVEAGMGLCKAKRSKRFFRMSNTSVEFLLHFYILYVHISMKLSFQKWAVA